jgi:hypothetical protein
LDFTADGMGVDVGDFNRDGRYDIYVTNLFKNALFIQQADGTFQNQATPAYVDDNGMTWGTFSFDYNNDGWPDIYMVNEYGFSPYSNKLFRNEGDVTFTDQAVNTPLAINKNGHGAAFSDFDNDGKLDIVVTNSNNGGIVILQNNENVGNWIKLNLVATSTNKFAVGAQVKVKIGAVELMQDLKVGSGYASQNSLTLHYGLGSATQADQISIRWPDGTVDQYQNVAANQRYLAVEKISLTTFDVTQYQQALQDPNQLSPPTDNPPPVTNTTASQSVARQWNETLLNAIRTDLARPTVHARNLFHFSLAMYDAWAAYDEVAKTVMLGNTWQGFTTPFSGITKPTDVKAAREEAMSYAAFRLLNYRFQNSPGAAKSIINFQVLFNLLGYDASITTTDYTKGPPAALGNYIAQKIIEFGLQDGSNEANGYSNLFYQPINSPLQPEKPGDPTLVDPNHWQPLKLVTAIDQAGNPVSSTQSFLGAEWGSVKPFALSAASKKTMTRDGHDYTFYHDPGGPPKLDTVSTNNLTSEYLWNYYLVSVWASHLDPADNVMIDVSPASHGNLNQSQYPTDIPSLRNFYKEDGGDISTGYTLNPKTNQPYVAQVVPRGDFARVLAEFWADGPKSETPPGHWFTIANYVHDHPQFAGKFKGAGNRMDDLEWDAKIYLALGGALHDAAVSAWGLKGYYDGTRPVSAIRYMGAKGQSSDKNSPHYSLAGFPLRTGLVELVKEGDPLAGSNNENVNKVKLYTWRGPSYITDPKTTDAGVGWILADNWYPYQKPTFVTPPFAGYLSGHSTYSSAGAEILSLFTGDEYFPGGLGEFYAPQNNFLSFEKGPSVDVKLQWARYKDAADESALSRIWGGIHPPFDDMPGRIIGKLIGADAFQLASKYFDGSMITAIREENFTVQVYPNPVDHHELLKVKLPDEMEVNIVLTDLMGRTIMTSKVSNDSGIDISSVVSGWYVIHFSGREISYSKKIRVN